MSMIRNGLNSMGVRSSKVAPKDSGRDESPIRPGAKNVFVQLRDAFSSLMTSSKVSPEDTSTNSSVSSSSDNTISTGYSEVSSDDTFLDIPLDGPSDQGTNYHYERGLSQSQPPIEKSKTNAAETRKNTMNARFNEAGNVLAEINHQLSKSVDIGEPPKEMGKKGDLGGKKKVVEKALSALKKENIGKFNKLAEKYNCKLEFFTFKSYETQLAKKIMSTVEAKALNDGPIKTKAKHFEVGGKNATDLQRPANDSLSITCGDTVVKLPGNRGETGVGCKTNQSEGSRIGNGNLSQLILQGEVVCSSVRHAVMSSLEVKNDTPILIGNKTQSINEALSEATDGGNALLEKSFPKETPSEIGDRLKILKEGGDVKKGLMQKMAQSISNQNKAKDTARLEVMKQLENMSPEDQKAILSGDKEMKLNMVSLSLLTPIGHEKDMLEQQVQAMQDISGSGTLTFDIGGEVKEIKVNIDQTCFNFGVNEGADIARGTEEELNIPSFWKFSTMVEDSINSIIENGTDEQKAKLVENKECIAALMEDLSSRMPDFGKADDPFDIPVKIALLADLTGMSPMFNCKSGKDRTGIMDVQMKAARSILENQIKSGNPINLDAISLDKLEEGSPELKEFQSTMVKMAQETSSKEIQAENTGLQGFKTNSKLKESGGVTKTIKNTLALAVSKAAGIYRDSDVQNMKKFGLDKSQLDALLYVDSGKTDS